MLIVTLAIVVVVVVVVAVAVVVSLLRMCQTPKHIQSHIKHLNEIKDLNNI